MFTAVPLETISMSAEMIWAFLTLVATSLGLVFALGN